MPEILDTTSAGPAVNRAESGRPPGRLRKLLIVGLLVVLGAAGLRMSPWAREHQYKRASLEILKSWAADSPRDAALQYYLGTQYNNASALPDAMAAFQRALALDPKMARAHVGMAGVQLRLGRAPLAIESARQAVKLEPKSVDAQFILGVATYQVSKTKARLEFERLTRMAPKRADAWYWLGRSARDANDASLALAPLQRAVDLEPKNAVYQRELGKVLLDLDRIEPSKGHLELALQYAPGDAEAHYLLARAMATTASSDKDLTRAEELMRRSIDLLGADPNPDFRNIAAVGLEWADILRRLGRAREALGVLKNARSMDPGNIRIVHHMGLAARSLKMEKEADAWLSEYSRLAAQQTSLEHLVQRVKQDEQNPALRLRLARSYAAARNYRMALNQYDVYLGMAPGSAEGKRERAALIRRVTGGGPQSPAGSTPNFAPPAAEQGVAPAPKVGDR